jgi:hypothetical protein
MSSFVPERPTLPPLRSLALPMHGVPSKMALPGVHVPCNEQQVRLLHLRQRQASDTAELFTAPRVRHLISPRLAAHTAGFRFLSPTSSVYRRSPRIHVVQLNSQLPELCASDEYCGTTCPPCPDRFSRNRRCRSRFVLDKSVKCVGTQSDFLSRCLG